MNQSWKGPLESQTENNPFFRKVLHTNRHQQLVLMNLAPEEEIGMEVHPKTSQFIRVESGTGKAILDGRTFRLKPGDGVVVDPGTRHNIIAGKHGLKLYTVYSPPEHEPGLVEE